jgi:hypothetical protein
MRPAGLLCLLGCLILSSALTLRAQSSPPPILVDAEKVQCPTAEFTSIQPAIDAASPGQTVHVCAGTYAEQLNITQSIILTADSGVVLQPTAMTANATGLVATDQIAAAIVVTNASSANISGFIVDGSQNGIVACAPRLIGILFQNSSGTVEYNAVRHFRLNSSLPGCQSGNAIEIETSAGGSSNVTVLENSVDDYQKNGITANEAGSNATIEKNIVNGIGPTTGAAQNGIQIGYGAIGLITNNTVLNNLWSPCVSTTQCSSNAIGILIFQSNGVQINANSVSLNNVGIVTTGTDTHISSNNVSNSVVLDGIALVSNSNTVEKNQIAQSDQAAVEVQGNDNDITGNTFLSAEAGILVDPGSTGVSTPGNQFFAVLNPIANASASAAASKQKAQDLPVSSRQTVAARVSPSR